MNQAATAKIRMIEASLRCFYFGLLALLPFIGIPFAVLALVLAGTARVEQRRSWNPAQPYQMAGGICAALGLIVWSFFLILIIWRLLNP
jgi:hypothetical protein